AGTARARDGAGDAGVCGAARAECSVARGRCRSGWACGESGFAGGRRDPSLEQQRGAAAAGPPGNSAEAPGRPALAAEGGGKGRDGGSATRGITAEVLPGGGIAGGG